MVATRHAGLAHHDLAGDLLAIQDVDDPSHVGRFRPFDRFEDEVSRPPRIDDPRCELADQGITVTDRLNLFSGIEGIELQGELPCLITRYADGEVGDLIVVLAP